MRRAHHCRADAPGGQWQVSAGAGPASSHPDTSASHLRESLAPCVTRVCLFSALIISLLLALNSRIVLAEHPGIEGVAVPAVLIPALWCLAGVNALRPVHRQTEGRPPWLGRESCFQGSVMSEGQDGQLCLPAP